MAWYQFIEHFIWKVGCMAKTTQPFDENQLLSKYAASKTLSLGEIKHFQREMFGEYCKLKMQFKDLPFNEI